MSSRLEEIAYRSNQDEPAHNHEHIRQPLAAGDTADAAASVGTSRGGGGGSGGRIANFGRVEVVTIWILWRRHITRVRRVRFRRSPAHVEAELHECDAQTGPGTVLGCVRGVKEVCE